MKKLTKLLSLLMSSTLFMSTLAQVSAMHKTTKDSMSYFDLDRFPYRTEQVFVPSSATKVNVGCFLYGKASKHFKLCLLPDQSYSDSLDNTVRYNLPFLMYPNGAHSHSYDLFKVCGLHNIYFADTNNKIVKGIPIDELYDHVDGETFFKYVEQLPMQREKFNHHIGPVLNFDYYIPKVFHLITSKK